MENQIVKELAYGVSENALLATIVVAVNPLGLQMTVKVTDHLRDMPQVDTCDDLHVYGTRSTRSSSSRRRNASMPFRSGGASEGSSGSMMSTMPIVMTRMADCSLLENAEVESAVVDFKEFVQFLPLEDSCHYMIQIPREDDQENAAKSFLNQYFVFLMEHPTIKREWRGKFDECFINPTLDLMVKADDPSSGDYEFMSKMKYTEVLECLTDRFNVAKAKVCEENGFSMKDFNEMVEEIKKTLKRAVQKATEACAQMFVPWKYPNFTEADMENEEFAEEFSKWLGIRISLVVHGQDHFTTNEIDKWSKQAKEEDYMSKIFDREGGEKGFRLNDKKMIEQLTRFVENDAAQN